VAGLYLALGISNALYRRTRTGEGCMIDVAMLDCQIAFLEAAIASCSATGAVPGPLGTRHPSIAPFQAFATADHPIVIGAGNDALFRTLCGAIGRGDLAADPRFANNSSRFAHVDDLQNEIERTLGTKPAAHWLAALDAAAVPSAPIQDVAQAMSMPQAQARAMILPVDCPSIGTFNVPGNPVKISDVPERGMRKPPPALDADRDRILAELVTSPRMHPNR
jgi:CoA:oxalate CoA-transferase